MDFSEPHLLQYTLQDNTRCRNCFVRIQSKTQQELSEPFVFFRKRNRNHAFFLTCAEAKMEPLRKEPSEPKTGTTQTVPLTVIHDLQPNRNHKSLRSEIGNCKSPLSLQVLRSKLRTYPPDICGIKLQMGASRNREPKNSNIFLPTNSSLEKLKVTTFSEIKSSRFCVAADLPASK